MHVYIVIRKKTIHHDELVLVDAGALHRSFCSDITRTFPVCGRFSDAQREVYEAVLRMQKRAIDVSVWSCIMCSTSKKTRNSSAVVS